MADTAVLGAGLSGLLFAHFWGEPVDIYEPQDRIGGLCRSFKDAFGNVYDIGPHILFSKDQTALETLCGFAPTNTFRRNNLIHIDGKYVKYPIENYLGQLEDADTCYKSFLNRKWAASDADEMPRNLLDWFEYRFGQELTRQFFEPLNRKIWRRNLREISTDWVSRVPQPAEQTVKAGRCEDTAEEGHTHQLNFQYPAFGGIESLIFGILNQTPNIESLYFGSSHQSWYSRTSTPRRIVSTFPLTLLLRWMRSRGYSAPGRVRSAVDRLKHLGLFLVAASVPTDYIRSPLSETLSILFPSSDIPFHRVTNTGFLAKKDSSRTVILLESTYIRSGPKTDPKGLWKRYVCDYARHLGLFGGSSASVTVTAHEVANAYPIHTHTRQEDVATIRDWLQKQNTYSIGRWGSHEYMNMDAVCRQAVSSPQMIRDFESQQAEELAK